MTDQVENISERNGQKRGAVLVFGPDAKELVKKPSFITLMKKNLLKVSGVIIDDLRPEFSELLPDAHVFGIDESDALNGVLAHGQSFVLKLFETADGKLKLENVHQLATVLTDRFLNMKRFLQNATLMHPFIFVGCDMHFLAQFDSLFPKTNQSRFKCHDLASLEGSFTLFDVGPKPKTGLKGCRLENIGPHKSLEMTFDPQWNVIIGDNGTGKTHLLRALGVATGLDPIDNLGPSILNKLFDLLRLKSETGRVSLESPVHHGHIRFSAQSADQKNLNAAAYASFLAQGHLVIGLGSPRTINPDPPYTNGFSTNRPLLSDLLPLITEQEDARMVNLQKWIVRMDHHIKTKKDIEPKEDDILMRLYKTIEALADGVHFEIKGVDPLTERVIVKTADGEFGLSQASQGMRSLFSIVGILAQRLYEVFGHLDAPAIMLIDEIDTHMHPKWQLGLGQRLMKAFPNVQFIVTSHSPLMVSGLKSTQVHRLWRDKEGELRYLAHLAEGTTIGKPEDLLTSSLFGLESALDPETTAKLKKYRELSIKDDDRSNDEDKRYWSLHEELEGRVPLPADNRLLADAQSLLARLAEEGLPDLFPNAEKEIETLIRRIHQELSVKGQS